MWLVEKVSNAVDERDQPTSAEGSASEQQLRKSRARLILITLILIALIVVVILILFVPPTTSNPGVFSNIINSL